jgi:hypothetical protein
MKYFLGSISVKKELPSLVEKSSITCQGFMVSGDEYQLDATFAALPQPAGTVGRLI